MNWPWNDALGRVLASMATLAPERPAKLESGDRIHRCPGCGCEQPGKPIGVLELAVTRGSEFVPIVAGREYACLRCEEIYCVGHTGVFRHDPKSQVYPGRNEAPPQAPPNPQEPERSLPPLYREAPRP